VLRLPFYENSEICPAGATCSRTGTPLPIGTLASAVVEGTQDIVGVVNETFVTIPAGQRQRQTVTSAFNQGAATKEVAVPLYKVNHDFKNSGVQLQNTNLTAAANYEATFKLGSPPVTYVLKGTIPAGQAVTLFKLYASLPPGASWQGTAMPSTLTTYGAVVITADQNIVAAVTEADEDPVNSSRQSQSSNGKNSLETGGKAGHRLKR